MRIDRVFYTNKENETESNAIIEKELSEYRIVSHKNLLNSDNAFTYERFPISSNFNSSPEIQTIKYMLDILNLAKIRDYSNIIICNDYFKFNVDVSEFYNNIDIMSNIYFDVLVMSGDLIHGNKSTMSSYLTRTIEVKNVNCYLVSSRYFERMIKTLSESLESLELTKNYDLYSPEPVLNKLARTDIWYCFESHMNMID